MRKVQVTRFGGKSDRLRVRMRSDAVYRWVVRNNTTLAALARRLDMHPTYLSQYLHGSRRPGPWWRTRILRTMKPLSWTDLFEEDRG
jgi:hypothetical protein